MTAVDSAELARLVSLCFDLSLSARVAAADRARFLVLGKRLRGCLVNLLSARFRDGTPEVRAANRRLMALNRNLAEVATGLAAAGAALKSLGRVVGLLDGLLGVATRFV